MKVYIAGKITNNPDYMKQFAEAETMLKTEGHAVINPTILPEGFEHNEYLRICLSMIDVCEGVFFLNNWADSYGARLEHRYSLENKKTLMFQSKLKNLYIKIERV